MVKPFDRLGSKQKPVARRSEGLAAGGLPGLLGYRLRLAQQAVFRDFADSVHGLSPGRVGLLVYIDANPGVTQSRLAEAVNRDRSTMVGVLDQLQARGLVERRRGAVELEIPQRGGIAVRVTLPLALPGVAAGSIFTFSLTLGDYIIPQLVGSSRPFIGQLVYQLGRAGFSVLLAQDLAVVPILIMALYLSVAKRFAAFDAL